MDVMDPFSMYITHSELPPPVVVPRRKKRLKQLQLELEKELELEVCCRLWLLRVCLSCVFIALCN